MSQVITYYSYKGGVGRSMALANTATLLAKWGYKILIIDWDLEAPGIENFFASYAKINAKTSQKGLIDLLYSFRKDSESLNWKDIVIPILITQIKTPIDIILCGEKNQEYFKRVREFDIGNFYENHDGGNQLENFRNEIKAIYDFILIDSRTGITESGGICTIHMADMNVLLFTPTEQSLKGVIEIGTRAMNAQQELPYDRLKLAFLPIPTRLDTQTEYEITQNWINKFADELQIFYKDWIPIHVDKKKFIESTKVPYIPYFSYGEKLPVLEQGTSDPSSIGYAYESISALLANNLEGVELFMEKRDSFLEKAKNNKISLPDENKAKGGKKSKKIFVSYNREDFKAVQTVISYLKVLENTNDVEIMVDFESILPGQNWSTEVKKILDSSDIVLAIMPHGGLFSSWVRDEIDYALENKKTIIPVYLDDFYIDPSNPLAKFQGILINTKDKNTEPSNFVKTMRRVIDHSTK